MLKDLWLKTESKTTEAIILVAVVVFLAFVGQSVYRILIPRRWEIECNLKDSGGKVISTVRAHPADERAYKRFMEGAQSRGETCNVTPSGKRYTSRK
jgi:hypothetical protein